MRNEHGKSKGLLALTVIFAFITGAAGNLFAQTDGREVMEQVYHRPTGETMSADLIMEITNSRGSVRQRSIRQYSRDADGTEKKVMFFTAPADVRDTSFMTWSYDDGKDDDQWIYLPALKRVKRISADSKNSSFMGSDFTYDDLGQRHPSEDQHRILRQESYRGEDCYVIESTPLGSDAEFSRTISWIIKDKWIGLKREYYNSSGEIFKTLEINSYDKTDGYLVITDMRMKNLDKGSETQIRMEDVSFDTNLSDSFFTERQMKMGPRR